MEVQITACMIVYGYSKDRDGGFPFFYLCRYPVCVLNNGVRDGMFRI